MFGTPKKKSRPKPGLSQSSIRHQLRGSPLAIPIFVLLVLSLPAFLLWLLLSGLSGLPALLALTRLSTLLTVLFHIVCHEYTPHSLQPRFPAPAIFVISVQLVAVAERKVGTRCQPLDASILASSI
jgi:hypothetical protein